MNNTVKGKLYVFEGIDGAGKTSAMASVHKLLEAKGETVVSVQNITQGLLGKLLRKIIIHEEPYINDRYIACLFLAELHNVVDGIKVYLNEGFTVLCDRWFYSTIAYLDSELFYPIINMANYDIKPDIIFYISVTPEVAINRLHDRGDNSVGDVFSTMDKAIKQIEQYNRIIGFYTGYETFDKHRFSIIDGEEMMSSIAETIFNQIEEDLFESKLLTFHETLGEISTAKYHIGVDYAADVELNLTPCKNDDTIVLQVMKHRDTDVTTQTELNFEQKTGFKGYFNPKDTNENL